MIGAATHSDSTATYWPFRAKGPMRTKERTRLVMSDGAVDDRADLTELVVRIAHSRDRAAFRELFVTFAPRVKTYLIRRGASVEKAEELAQETLLTVWRKASYFDPARACASAWLFTIARNLRIDALRRENSAIAYALKIEPDEVEPNTPETDSQIAERQDRIRAAIAVLPPEQLEVIQLSYFQDKPHAEIADELALPLGTVKSRLRLALAKLRGLVGDLA